MWLEGVTVFIKTGCGTLQLQVVLANISLLEKLHQYIYITGTKCNNSNPQSVKIVRLND